MKQPIRWYFINTEDNIIFDMLRKQKAKKKATKPRGRRHGIGSLLLTLVLLLICNVPGLILLVLFGYPLYLAFTGANITSTSMRSDTFQEIHLTPIEPIMLTKGFVDATINQRKQLSSIHPLLILLFGGLGMVAIVVTIFNTGDSFESERAILYGMTVAGFYLIVMIGVSVCFAASLGVWCGILFKDQFGAAVGVASGLILMSIVLTIAIASGLIVVTTEIGVSSAGIRVLRMILLGSGVLILMGIPVWLTGTMIDHAASRLKTLD